jgi:hypothetical protein
MPIRQDKAVAIDPLRVCRIVLHHLVVQQVDDRRAAKRRAGMTGISFLNGIDGEKAEGVDGKLV